MKPVEQKHQLERLSFIDKIRHWIGRRVWIPMNSKSAPYGRLVICRLSNCEYRFMPLRDDYQYRNGGTVKVTHWIDPPNL